MSVTTIDQVLEQLDEIIDWSRREGSRLGYFAALYRVVTAKVKERIAASGFADGARMERLDVAFALRYLDALEQFRRGEKPAACWDLAFTTAPRWRPLILQHLLLGMNAHINYDLGAASAEVGGSQLSELRSDFDAINNILAELFGDVQDRITTVSPWMGLLDRLGHDADEAVINFSLGRARNAAWSVAERLNGLEGAAQTAEVAALDRRVTRIGRLVRHPGMLLSTTLLVVRRAERHDVPKVIGTLCGLQR